MIFIDDRNHGHRRCNPLCPSGCNLLWFDGGCVLPCNTALRHYGNLVKLCLCDPSMLKFRYLPMFQDIHTSFQCVRGLSLVWCKEERSSGSCKLVNKIYVDLSLGSALWEASHGLSALWENASRPRPIRERAPSVAGHIYPHFSPSANE